ncbi:TDP-N-acetylfucosamine:lipid II N-acetylfucosaminyltransferase [Gracilimonas sp. Q87]|uniref:TDP-N-acetylfucosamine:lipid II N-acetylfucosaminyltransferase n=1 Tax=Gracilimonas sp. Q87 TaxID=3384766 RepID=UPI00398435AE
MEAIIDINMEQVKNGKKVDKISIECFDGITICTPPDIEMLTPYVLLEQNEWYENELDFIRDYLKPGMNFVDIGTGFGVYALPAANLTGKEGKVYSFEPGNVAKKYLEMSKLENDLENLEIIGKAVWEKAGKQKWKIAETPEFNKLDETGEEEVQTITLDGWWMFEGEPKIDILKIDVNGAEAEVLKGALDLLESESPVLLISIAEKNVDFFADALKDHGYTLYEYIPGPGILVDYNIEVGAGPYRQNLVGIPESKIEDFRKAGWMHDESVKPKEVKKDLWKTELSKLPWTQVLMKQWENHGESEGIMSYLQALNYLISAEQIDITDSELHQPRSKKAVLLLKTAQILIQLYNQGANSTSVTFTLVRTLNALGKRGQAVEVMQKLIETTKFGQENMDVDLPFMLPIQDQDNNPIKTDLPKWLMVKTVEAWILLKDMSTYLSGKQERKLLEVLEGNPELITRLKDFLKLKEERFSKAEFNNGVINGIIKAKKSCPKVIHICFNHIYAQSLSDLIEHVNLNSDQQHMIYIETHRAIPNYSVEINNNPAATLFNFQKNIECIAQECLKEHIDMVMFHGIFFDWQKKLINTIGDKKHIGWFMWGGDLYNPIKANETVAFPDHYINSIHSAFQGDKDLYKLHYQEKPEFDFVYPIPGLYGKVEVTDNNPGGKKRIIVGNSGDESNEHISILKQLAAKEDLVDYEIVLPVAYNFSKAYKQKLVETIKFLKFENSVEFHTEFIAPSEYLNFLAGADMIITAHNRQQSMGNLIMSLYLNKPSFLRRMVKINGDVKENPGWGFLLKNDLQPLDYQSFDSYKSLSDIPKPSTDELEDYQKTFLQKFGLKNSAELLKTSCSQIVKN